ncbi:MAG: hypothetical protein B5M56_09295 [Desulfococcus sp. 4484_241]|nr:MAG: hypothetical protein B5M56_09295 [Desulfococcus sp. 4484_241]
MDKLDYKRYLFVSGVLSVVLLVSVAAFNYFIDPYNLMGNNWTGVYFWNERQLKGREILNYDHQAVLIGSSKTGYVNPDDLECYRFYNASMRGMVPEEIYFFLKKYLRNEKLVLVGFDFYMFNEREFPLITIKDWDDVAYNPLEYLLGISTLKMSKKTLKHWKNHDPIFRMHENGQFDYPGSKGKPLPARTRQEKKKYRDIINGLVEHHYGDFVLSRQRMEYVRKLKELFENREIPYAVFINPLSSDVLAALRHVDAYPVFLKWRKDMRTIFPNIYDFSSGPYSDPKLFHSDDPYHYTNEAGKEFLNRIIRDFCENKQADGCFIKPRFSDCNEYGALTCKCMVSLR